MIAEPCSDPAPPGRIEHVIEQLAAASDAELLAAVAELEVELSRLRHRQLTVLAELSARNTAGVLGYRGLAGLISVQLRCTPAEARRHAQAVERFGPRRGLTGQALEPVFAATAAALAEGAITPEHAAEIAAAVETIPAGEHAEHAQPVEAALLEQAKSVDPQAVRLLGRRILAHLDPDGPTPTEQRLADTHRRLTLTPLQDGGALLEGRLSPTCRAIWEAILTPLAAVRPDDAAGPDQRTPGHRRHDALEEAGRRLLATGELPEHAGLPTQLIITLTLTDLERRAGRATTAHGGTLTIREALRLAADAKMIPVVLDQELGIAAYGRGRRLASAGQRKALIARDRGCTFPGCTRTDAQSQIHHTTDWAAGGRTDLDNLAITCGYHNNHAAPAQGWTSLMIGGIPHWQPPDWHPNQHPQRNYQHHPELLTPPAH